MTKNDKPLFNLAAELLRDLGIVAVKSAQIVNRATGAFLAKAEEELEKTVFTRESRTD